MKVVVIYAHSVYLKTMLALSLGTRSARVVNDQIVTIVVVYRAQLTGRYSVGSTYTFQIL